MKIQKMKYISSVVLQVSTFIKNTSNQQYLVNLLQLASTTITYLIMYPGIYRKYSDRVTTRRKYNFTA